MVKIEHHCVAVWMTGKADAQWRRRDKRHDSALQIGPRGLQSLVIAAHHKLDGIDLRYGGDLPLISSPPPGAYGGPSAGSGMSGQGYAHSVSQAIFIDGAAEADFQVNAPRFGRRI
jgi:hypothetical protein